MSNSGTVYILGGGPAGLALVDALAEADQKFVLVERAASMGGLAQSLAWKDYGHHDLGPHKIFTTDQDLLTRIKNLLPADQWLTREKKSSIYMGGHFLPYPPSPFSLINVFGPLHFVKMCIDYGFAMIKSFISSFKPATFEQDLEHRVGRKLYKSLFRPIAEKLWGNPKDLDSKLSKGRVQTPRISEIIARLLKIQKSSTFEALEFIYPSGGLQRLWDRIKEKGTPCGSYVMNHEVKSIEVSDGKVLKIICKNRADNNEAEFTVGDRDFVFSTLPLKILASAITPALPENTRDLLDKKVILNDLLLVFLLVDKKSLLDESWIFVPDPQIVFHRISEQESFDPGMTPQGSIVCCEVMNNELRNMNSKSDQELLELVTDGLRKMNYTGFKIIDHRVIRLPSSYPVFRPGYETALNQVLAEFDSLKNFRTVGRQGAFNYIGTLDAMDIGYGSARWFLGSTTNGYLNGKGAQSWEQERERTRHYPVLD